MSGKPFANQTVDHIYLNSLQNIESAKSQDSTKSCGVLTNKKGLPPKRQTPDQKCVEISNNKRSRLHTSRCHILFLITNLIPGGNLSRNISLFVHFISSL